MIKQIFTSFLILTAFMNLSCGTNRKAIVEDSVNQQKTTKPPMTFNKAQYLKKVYANKSTETALAAKIKCTIRLDEKSITTYGQIKMKKDDFVQISLLDPVVGIMELVRIEFNAQNMLLIDRYNKRYMDVPYSQVEFLKKCDIDFHSLQNLFWNYIFIPDKKEANDEHFTFHNLKGEEPRVGEDVSIKYIDDILTYTFNTQYQTGRLTNTIITGNKDQRSKFSFNYDDFQDLKGKLFPNKMVMNFVMDNKNAAFSFELNSIKNKLGKAERTQIPTKYTKTDPEKIFNEIIKR